MRIAAPDTTLNVTEYGVGRPLILVHGGTGTGWFDWQDVIPDLAERYRVITLDLRGHGGTSAPGWRLGIHRYGLDIAHVMRSLGIPRAGLIGFSAGANSILTLLVRRPQVATGFVLIGGSFSSEPDRIDEILSGPWPADLKGLRHEVASDEEHWNLLRETLAKDWAANNTFTRDELGAVSAPALVVHGSRDRTVPAEQADLLAAALRNSEVWIAEGARHMVQREQPAELVARVLPFLDSLPW